MFQIIQLLNLILKRQGTWRDILYHPIILQKIEFFMGVQGVLQDSLQKNKWPGINADYYFILWLHFTLWLILFLLYFYKYVNNII